MALNMMRPLQSGAASNMGSPFFAQLGPIQKQPGEIGGLSYVPTSVPICSDDTDDCFRGQHPPVEFSECNQKVVADTFETIKSTAKCIVEIGVSRNPDYSKTSTSVFLSNKSKDCHYIGIDLDDKSSLNDVENNIHTLKIDSSAHIFVFELMDQLGIDKIDLLMIDGWHSVNQCLSDWQYTSRLSDSGIVIMHDTNFHPGPSLLFEAIDGGLYEKEKFCNNPDIMDWGISVVRRK